MAINPSAHADAAGRDGFAAEALFKFSQDLGLMAAHSAPSRLVRGNPERPRFTTSSNKSPRSRRRFWGDLARNRGLNLPLARVTKEQYDRITSENLGDLDKSGIAELTFKDRHKHSGDV